MHPENVDRQLRRIDIAPEEIRHMEQKSKAVLKRYQMNMRPFMELYTKEQVERDYAQIAKKVGSRMSIDKRPNPERLGKIFEGAILDLAFQHHWFGEKSEVVKSSLYDDEINGADLIVTTLDIDNRGFHFEMATDVTISQEGVRKKIDRITSHVDKGKLGKIKYFHSEMLGYTGQLDHVPRTVIGLGRNNMIAFLREWNSMPNNGQQRFAKIFLQQISLQSEYFRKRAESLFGEDSIVSNKYAALHSTATRMLEDKSFQGLVEPEDEITAYFRNLKPT